MKVDWDELKRLKDLSLDPNNRDWPQAAADWGIALDAMWPAILAERSAAQRLRYAARPFCKFAEGTVGRITTERLSASNWHELWKALEAFDRESKND